MHGIRNLPADRAAQRQAGEVSMSDGTKVTKLGLACGLTEGLYLLGMPLEQRHWRAPYIHTADANSEVGARNPQIAAP